MSKDNGTVNIRGKEYQTVAKRIADFRGKHPSHSIITDIISNADVVIIKAEIADENGRLISTGYAEEVRNSTNINKTSAVENCETSAVGRALAFFGYGGSEIASANEVSDAIIAGAKKEVVDYMVSYANVLREKLDVVLDVQVKIIEDDIAGAATSWFENLTEEEQAKLWLAPTKGGIFTTKEREIIKSSIFRESYYGDKQ